MLKKVLFFVILSLLLADTVYSFLQFYHTPLDGDMPGAIVPFEKVQPILDSPLGFKIFKEDINYPNPNRFFCHWSMYKYFNTVPIWLQKFTSPINSAYLSSAIAKILIQLIILFLLAFAISGKINFKFEVLLSALLIVSLFQTNGYRSYMGIIDPATTYTFFYALPTAVILLYFAPLFFKHFYNLELPYFKYIRFLWLPLALISSLSGVLNPGIALIISSMLIFENLYTNLKYSKENNMFSQLSLAVKQLPKSYYFFLLPISIFSIYSLFLGRYNSVDLEHQMPLATLYARLPEGIYYSFTQKLGFPVLFAISLINSILIKKCIHNSAGKQILKAFKWIAIFSLLYILLLPLGGYRTYRPYVLRYDTIIPISLALFFIYGKSSMFILQHASKKQKAWYITLLVLVIFVFANADEAEFDKNKCERAAIEKIASSNDSIVEISNKCNVLSWEVIENPKDSKLQIELLKRWRIINEDKLYYQK